MKEMPTEITLGSQISNIYRQTAMREINIDETDSDVEEVTSKDEITNDEI